MLLLFNISPFFAASGEKKRERRGLPGRGGRHGVRRTVYEKKKLRRGLSLLLAVLIAGVCLLSGCGAQKNEAQENAETIQVYLWNTTLYENYAPYIQSQLPM